MFRLRFIRVRHNPHNPESHFVFSSSISRLISNCFPYDICHIAMDNKLKNIASKLKSRRTTHDQLEVIDALKHAWPALKLALTVFEKTLDGVPIPGLKGAIGGILELAKTAEVSVAVTKWRARLLERSQLSRRRSRMRRMSLSSRSISHSLLAFFNAGMEHTSSLQSSKPVSKPSSSAFIFLCLTHNFTHVSNL